MEVGQRAGVAGSSMALCWAEWATSVLLMPELVGSLTDFHRFHYVLILMSPLHSLAALCIHEVCISTYMHMYVFILICLLSQKVLVKNSG